MCNAKAEPIRFDFTAVTADADYDNFTVFPDAATAKRQIGPCVAKLRAIIELKKAESYWLSDLDLLMRELDNHAMDAAALRQLHEGRVPVARLNSRAFIELLDQLTA